MHAWNEKLKYHSIIQGIDYTSWPQVKVIFIWFVDNLKEDVEYTCNWICPNKMIKLYVPRIVYVIHNILITSMKSHLHILLNAHSWSIRWCSHVYSIDILWSVAPSAEKSLLVKVQVFAIGKKGNILYISDWKSDEKKNKQSWSANILSYTTFTTVSVASTTQLLVWLLFLLLFFTHTCMFFVWSKSNKSMWSKTLSLVFP